VQIFAGRVGRQQRLRAVLELAFGELDGTRQQVQRGYFSGQGDFCRQRGRIAVPSWNLGEGCRTARAAYAREREARR
jgi:hypothetical protein